MVDLTGSGTLSRNGRRERRTRKVSEVVAHEIVHDIVANDLQPGAKLPPETVMLEQYDVGRASLREGLRILEVHGLIQIRPGPGGGPIVADVDSRDFGRMATLYLHVARATFRDLVEARLTLEPTMARLVAERGDPADRDRLQATLDAMTAALEADDNEAYLTASTDFHGAVSGMSGNPVLDLFARSIKDMFADRVSAIMFPAEDREAVAEVHEDIANAIFAGDGGRAETLMREHMAIYHRKAAERFPGLLSEVVDWV